MLVNYDQALNSPDLLLYASRTSTEIVHEVLMNAESYLKSTYMIAGCDSHDPDTNVGALLINPITGQIVFGANTLTDGMHTSIPEKRRLPVCNRPLKYQYMEHAERNVIYKAASKGYCTKDFIMIAPYFSCVECSRAIVQSGISLVIGHKQIIDMAPERWKESIKIGRELFDAAGVDYIEYDKPFTKDERYNLCTILFDGKPFNPHD